MKDCDKNKEYSYVKYWNVNNLCGWAMSHKLPRDDFKLVEETSEFNEVVIKNDNIESDEGHFLEDDVHYPENLHNLYNDFPFLPRMMNIFFPERMKIEKFEKLVANLHCKEEYVIHITNLK